MSARRMARSSLVSNPGGVPDCLRIGRCIEVWGDPRADVPWASAVRRHSLAWRHWMTDAQIDTATACSAAPKGAPYSADLLQDSRTPWRLEAAGFTVDDLPALTRQARQLIKAAEAVDSRHHLIRQHGRPEGA